MMPSGLTDVAINYRLPKRYGFITVGATNLFDREFEFFDTDTEQSKHTTQPGSSLVESRWRCHKNGQVMPVEGGDCHERLIFGKAFSARRRHRLRRWMMATRKSLEDCRCKPYAITRKKEDVMFKRVMIGLFAISVVAMLWTEANAQTEAIAIDCPFGWAYCFDLGGSSLCGCFNEGSIIAVAHIACRTKNDDQCIKIPVDIVVDLFGNVPTKRASNATSTPIAACVVRFIATMKTFKRFFSLLMLFLLRTSTLLLMLLMLLFL